ncbi:MAG: hypothetical protein LBT05_03010 [Planctomycetaceae bacterium]|nr:hypothetical protein [Planctomycetaceae bacterium]
MKPFLKDDFDVTKVSQIVAVCHSECEHLQQNFIFTTAKEIDQCKIISEDDIQNLHRKVSKLINDISNEILKLNNEVNL